MKNLFFLLILGASALLFTSCEDTEVAPTDQQQIADQFTVPDIPPEIAELLTPEDITRFELGPGADYLNAVRARSLAGHARGPARWHPVVIHMGYDLQFVPIGGTSCNPGDFIFCFGPGAPANPTECLAHQVGISGAAIGDGQWLGTDIHAEYYPVFCLPDDAGYGQGYFEAEEGILWFTATSTAHLKDGEGNATFYIHGTFVPNQSTGIFEGASGWLTAFVFTAAENVPGDDGLGYADTAILGWVFF